MRRTGPLCLLLLVILVSASAGRPAPPPRRPTLPPRPAPPGVLSPRALKLKQVRVDRRPAAKLAGGAFGTLPAGKDKVHKPVPLDAELNALQGNVTLGNWAAVKACVAGAPRA